MNPRIPFTLLVGLLVSCDDGSGDDTAGDPPVDSDGDGLFDDEEAEIGTDPSKPDTDGDGFSDYDEVQSGTNPLWIWSHVYTGGYNVGTCEDGPRDPTGATGTGRYEDLSWDVYQEGDASDNFTMTDQHGEEVSLYSFCGQHVMLEFSAFW
ncbi:MAG: hypothetical protein JXB39_00955 [Deltaproteobacteria bacterium]|nr:hypothetical protein [Deltaproteobacteria bacterium]